ncbi:MAG: GTPase HflX [Gammaproteobacteria bacterium]|nr:MAG: GTPase HflX [Gammaproteobacteria bacterium]
MLERPRSGERAILVHLDFGQGEPPDVLQEFSELVRSAGVIDLTLVTGSRKTPDARFFIGSGKAHEVKGQVDSLAADLVIIDHALSPSQERNLERLLKCRVVDRSGLILDIFAQRARTFEGKLQVELAQLKHLSTRLVRGWSHLERQKGGIGLRGPGETQLETDRRLIGGRIRRLRERLKKVASRREIGRRARRGAHVPTVSLVGYTNAGKSTLFNALTGSETFIAAQLFATLDPTLRRLQLPGGSFAVLADTVGFIRQLPHELVAAFRSTLEETREASLLLHIVDASHQEKQIYIEAVEQVLEEIGALQVPRIEVYNKIDLCGQSVRIERNEAGQPRRVWVSAETGDGLDQLCQAMTEYLRDTLLHGWVKLMPKQGKVRAGLYAKGVVRSEQTDSQGCSLLKIDIYRSDLEELDLDQAFYSQLGRLAG